MSSTRLKGLQVESQFANKGGPRRWKKIVFQTDILLLYILPLRGVTYFACFGLLGKDVLRNSVNDCVLHWFAGLHSEWCEKAG